MALVGLEKWWNCWFWARWLHWHFGLVSLGSAGGLGSGAGGVGSIGDGAGDGLGVASYNWQWHFSTLMFSRINNF